VSSSRGCPALLARKVQTLEGRRRALLVGVNQCGLKIDTPSLKYAEDDVRAIHDVLVDHRIGTFDDVDVQVLIGDDATSRKIKDRLRDIALDSKPSDVLLVYFAGHALVPEWSRQTDAYLATADLDIDVLRREPEAGLRMAFLRRDVFEDFAGASFLVLDCCHAGAYLDSDLRSVEGIGAYGTQLDRHSALLSCPRGAAARESDDYRHGVVTYQVLRALRGEASDAEGRVSFLQMANFVAEQGLTPTPGQLVQMWGPTTTLTQPRRSRQQPPLTQSVGSAKVVPCENPLDRSAVSIHQLLGRIFRSERKVPHQHPSGSGKLERICRAVDAESVAVVELRDSGARVVNATFQFDQTAVQPMLEQCAVQAFPVQSTTVGHLASDHDGRKMLCVPLSHDETRALVLAVVDPASSLLDMGEPLAVLLQEVWKMDVFDDPLQAEVHVLTALRATCGRLPLSLYEHCFTLYQELIASLTMVFQPVIHLDRRARGVGIHSYEALARRAPNALRAPVKVLQVAKVWGDRFFIARDALLLTKALESYAEADSSASWDVPKPVSINVAVRSLLHDSYAAVVRTALAATNLNPHTVTLEISEQDPITPAPHEQWPQKPLTYFHNRLRHLARELEISFAVDDFGVGYSSLARLAELPLTQIKVDRDVLYHPLALEELDLVVRVAGHAKELGVTDRSRDVVVEGFDQDAPVSLRDIYERKIRYVQGFIAEEPASTSLHQLSDAVRERIAAQVRGDDEQRQAEIAAGDRRGAGPAL